MDKINEINKEIKGKTRESVHKVLAHSYFFFSFVFLSSLFLDFIFPIKIFDNYGFVVLGIFLIFISTILIFWAQNTSRNLDKSNITKETFSRGPYRFTRTPTHFGLFFLMLGFGCITNAFFVILFSFFYFFISKFSFLKKQESILLEKYGDPYAEYRKSVIF